MRTLPTLLRKEWRENRALIAGLAVVAPIGSAIALATLPGEGGGAGALAAWYVLPALVSLFLFTIGSDLFAGEASSGRIALLAGLPLRPAAAWAAKSLFLYGSATLYTGYSAAVLVLLLPLFQTPAPGIGWILGEFEPTTMLALAAGSGAVLFFSVLIPRGLSAGFAAAVLLGIAYGVAHALPEMELVRAFRHEPFRRVVLGIGAAALAAGSFLVFTRGRPHLPAGGRRAFIAVAAFAGLLLAPAAWAQAVLADYYDLAPGDPDLKYQIDYLSPEGDAVVVGVSRQRYEPLSGSRRRAFETWTVSLDGRTLLESSTPERGPWQPGTFPDRAESAAVRDAWIYECSSSAFVLRDRRTHEWSIFERASRTRWPLPDGSWRYFLSDDPSDYVLRWRVENRLERVSWRDGSIAEIGGPGDLLPGAECFQRVDGKTVLVAHGTRVAAARIDVPGRRFVPIGTFVTAPGTLDFIDASGDRRRLLPRR